MSFLMAVVAGIGVGKLVDMGLKGLGYLASKTSTKKDDQFVEFLQKYAPDLVECFEEHKEKAKAPAPRPQLRDHRGSLN